MENTKLSRSVAVIDRILRILQGFAVAAFIVAAIFIPLTAFLGEKIIANSSNLQIGVIYLRLSGAPESYLDTANIKASIIFMLVGIGHVLDTHIIGTGSVLRTAIIFFYLSNEGVSLLENAAHLGLPIPEKLKDVLEQLHDRAEKEGE